MSQPWSDFELQCLYDVVNDINWYEQAAPLLPARSEASARTKMSALRREAGIMARNHGPRAQAKIQTYREVTTAASKRLAAAINAARELEVA